MAMMKAAVFIEPGRIELVDKPIPDVGPNDALIRITTTTICGTDIHILKGEYPVEKGLTVGHEPVGIIEKLGSNAHGYQEGQRVIAGAICPSFTSYPSQDGFPSQDGAWIQDDGTCSCHGYKATAGWRFGNWIDGTQAEYVLVPDAQANLVPVPDSLTDEQVLMCPDIMSTGFVDLDAKTAGLHGGDLTIVAGRPAMGKTSFSMNIVEHVALVEKKPVLVFSMEMGAAQLAHRMLGSVGKIDQQRMRKGTLNNEDWVKVTRAVDRLQHAQIFIDETPGLNPIDLRARARRLSRKHGGLGLIVVDYLQLMSGSGLSRSDNRANEISEISRSLKGLARELNCPVIALSQLNRSLENRPNKRPIMSDLRESGAIEQDADVIIFIYRDEVYNENSPDKGVAEIILGKQRNGPIGTVRLTFVGEHTKFMNYTGASPAFVGE